MNDIKTITKQDIVELCLTASQHVTKSLTFGLDFLHPLKNESNIDLLVKDLTIVVETLILNKIYICYPDKILKKMKKCDSATKFCRQITDLDFRLIKLTEELLEFVLTVITSEKENEEFNDVLAQIVYLRDYTDKFDNLINNIIYGERNG